MSEQKKTSKIKLEISKQDLTPELIDSIHQRLLQKLASKATEPEREGMFSKSGFSKNGFSRSSFSKSQGTY